MHTPLKWVEANRGKITDCTGLTFRLRKSRHNRRLRNKILMTTTSKRTFLVMAASIAVTLTACTMDDDKKPGVSNDISALRAFVDIPASVRSGQWEIFGTPEYTGGVPGPTDYMTLIAALEMPASQTVGESGNQDWKKSLVPEARRPWLPEYFRSLLAQHKNDPINATTPGCALYRTSIKQSGRPVKGFICRHGDQALIYLSLLSPGQ